MNKTKYIGLDVHQASISVAVLEESGKLMMQSVLATRASAIMELLDGLRGTLQVTFEEGTYSAWLYDLLVRRVSRVVVCNPRKNALLKAGNKSDRIDALKLAELLRRGLLSPVYHGENSTRTLQELARSYQALTEDTTWVMSRLKAIYRSQAIACGGQKLYTQRHRGEWLQQLRQPGTCRRAERLYEQLDVLQQLRRQAKQELMGKAKSIRCARDCAVFPTWVRFAPRCWWRECRHRIASAASASSGDTVAWPWKRGAAPITSRSQGR